MSTSTITLTPELYGYYASHAYREPDVLRELRQETAKLGGNANMQIAPEQGAFMAMIAGLMNAGEILEIGTFTGYSSLAMALGSSARVTAVDVSEEWTTIARRYWQKAGIGSRMHLRLDGGTAAISDLLKQDRAGTFDLCFIDADKTGYDTYYEGCLKLLRAGGLVMIDNVLWGGEVANRQNREADTEALRALNHKVKGDTRIELCMVPIGDGLTMARKK